MRHFGNDEDAEGRWMCLPCWRGDDDSPRIQAEDDLAAVIPLIDEHVRTEVSRVWAEAVQAQQLADNAHDFDLRQAWTERDAAVSLHRDAFATLSGEVVRLRERAERAEAELSALRATDEYQRWARAVVERDAARERITKALQFVNHELADAVLTEFDHGAHSALAVVRAALDQPTPREETPT